MYAEGPDGVEIDAFLLGERLYDESWDLSLFEHHQEIFLVLLVFLIVFFGSDELIDLLSELTHILLAFWNELEKGGGDLDCHFLRLVYFLIKVFKDKIKIF